MISDNQTWHDVGCYGNETVQTPNIDKLAAEGVRFEEAFATTPSCGPSRAVMYTGLLTHSNGQYALEIDIRNRCPLGMRYAI